MAQIQKHLITLNYGNYDAWASKLSKLISVYDLSNHIEENNNSEQKKEETDDQWLQDDQEVTNIILGSVDENLKKSVSEIKTAAEIWSKLKVLCEEKSVYDLLSQLENFKVSASNLKDSIIQLENLLEQIKQHNLINQDSNYLKIKLINSLPSSFKTIKLELIQDNDLDYEVIKSKLFEFEKNLSEEMKMEEETVKKEDDDELQNSLDSRTVDYKDKPFIIDSSKSQDHLNKHEHKIQDVRYMKQEDRDAIANEQTSKKEYPNSTNYNGFKNKEKTRKRDESADRYKEEHKSNRHHSSERKERSKRTHSSSRNSEKDTRYNKYDSERNSDRHTPAHDDRVPDSYYCTLEVFRLLQEQETKEQCEKILLEHMAKSN